MVASEPYDDGVHTAPTVYTALSTLVESRAPKFDTKPLILSPDNDRGIDYNSATYAPSKIWSLLRSLLCLPHQLRGAHSHFRRPFYFWTTIKPTVYTRMTCIFY